jgi:hypothetical protein
MTMAIKITFRAERIARKGAKPTIYDNVKARLGREPTSAELREECLTIMRGSAAPQRPRPV